MPKKNKKFKVHTSLSGAMGYNPMKALDDMIADLKGKGTRKSKSKIKLVKKAEGGMPESRIILPKRKTIVKPEVFKEKSDTGVTKKGSKVTVGKKILGVDVIGQVAQQKYSSPRGESKRRTKSFTAKKNIGDRGSFGIEAYDSTSSNPMNRSKTKGIKGSLTLTFSEGGIARGGRAAIRGIKFTGVK